MPEENNEEATEPNNQVVAQKPKKIEAEWRKKFRQQESDSWNPIFSPRFAFPAFLISGLVFLPIGIGLFIASNSITETKFDYTQCSLQATSSLSSPPSGIDSTILKWRYSGNVCTIQFTVNNDLSPSSSSSSKTRIGSSSVLFYIRLSGMYQNHHKIVSSFDINQLGGTYLSTASLVSGNCDPLRYAECELSDYSQNGSNKSRHDSKCNLQSIKIGSGAQYYPCGLLPNSFFTDVITDPVCISDLKGASCSSAGITSNYKFSTIGIAWPEDKSTYAKSEWLIKNSSAISTQLIPPPQWQRSIPAYANGYNTSNLPDLASNERFINWMMPAGLPTFRKLWGRNDTLTMKAGIYQINITEYFDVYRFSGTKAIVYSTSNVLGGKNIYMGIGFMAVGGYSLTFAIFVVILYLLFPRKMGDQSLLSWNQPEKKSSSRKTTRTRLSLFSFFKKRHTSVITSSNDQQTEELPVVITTRSNNSNTTY